MQLLRWALRSASLIVLLAIPATAQASIGVGIQAGPVRLGAAAHPGGSYALPPVYVVNTGTQPEALTVRIERVSSGPGRPVPASWVHASGSAVRLSHNQGTRIPLQLVLPATAPPGQYLTDVVVRGSASVSDGGANLGVAAATKLQFRIVPGVVSAGWFSMPRWVLLTAAAMVALVAIALMVRRSGVRIRIEREPAAASPAGAGSGNDAA
jgi:hypothetical protein